MSLTFVSTLIHTASRRLSPRFMTTYSAYYVTKLADGGFQGSETQLDTQQALPSSENNDTLIHVAYSSLNYKDALSANGKPGVTKTYPHTPGIDAVGKVVETSRSSGGAVQPGQTVIVTGYDLGMNTPGGFGEYIRVPSTWCAKLPEEWKDSPATAMKYGTAGLTAALQVHKLLDLGKAKPTDGPVAVTGASGAVGSVATELLAKLGFSVTAISGKVPSFLKDFGAVQVLGRDTLASTNMPLVRPDFAHAVDTVGGEPLAELLKHIQPGGSVACCGLVAGAALPTTVLPFILRGVNLLGVDIVEIPLEQKQAMWDKLATDWRCPKTEALAKFIGRHELEEHLLMFLNSQSAGKVVLQHSLTKKSSL